MAQVALTPPNRTHLIKIIAQHPNILTGTSRDRLSFLENTGLADDIKGKILLGDVAERFAEELIRVCQTQGTLTETQLPALVSVILYLREEMKGQEENVVFLDSLLVQFSPSLPTLSPLSHEAMMDMFTAALDYRSAGDLGQALNLLRDLRRQNFETFLDLDSEIREVEAEHKKVIRRQRMPKEYDILARYIRDSNPQQGRVAWDNFCKRYPEFNFITDLPSDYLYPPTPKQQRLLDVMLNIRIPPPQRAEAGRELAKIGDPRRGVGVLPNGVPDIVWCEVAGKDKGRPPSCIGGDKELLEISKEYSLPVQIIDLDTYWIAKYSITFLQYRAFIADQGYEVAQWWEGLQRVKPDEQIFKFDNHPHESVTWYEAIAFCRWWSAKVGMEMRLPTEEEWEQAARGEKSFYYPWGNKYKSGHANIDETNTKVGPYYLETTTAVGIYPHGVSPYGVLDMAGNVWEWTISAWEADLKLIEQVQGSISNNIYSERVLRGGSWYHAHDLARSAARNFNPPINRNYRFGFRALLLTNPNLSLGNLFF